MPIPSEIAALIERLNNELNQIEQEATEGLILARARLPRFSNNFILLQLFVTLNNYMLFIEITRRRIEHERAILLSGIITDEQIQEIGEYLAEELGRVLEAKIVVDTIKNRLENWL